ncbi:MAG: IclR family transcriptional regulator [Alicyclobacillus macrosporangiidus]|uniref:IclR family transcriptional regulator n=1 Tax=Alicyclobacillus macrosporangiidus TaxID=392015 RepID=UPI0026F2A4EC|nr:IclR family transcriptional regulator [Alicyclobacillus macrosporangiidus]MCL6600418.1 IclR family transcriptional regulator [Alicyclobacillus macrosporangiidus]
MIESVIKTLQVLFAFSTPPHRFTLPEIESMVGLSKNQVFRSVKSLEEFGLLRMEASGYYRVTPLIYQVAFAAEIDLPLEEVAQPILEQLHAATQETVHLCCLVEGQAVIVARRHSNHSVKLTARLGQRMALHAGACPKAMLAFLPRDEQERVLSMVPLLQRYTDKTVQSGDALRIELEDIRRRGYSISDEDFEYGARGVGAPIFDRRGRVIGGISAGGPVTRVDLETLHHFGELVVEAAYKVSRLLGYLEFAGELDKTVNSQ